MLVTIQRLSSLLWLAAPTPYSSWEGFLNKAGLKAEFRCGAEEMAQWLRATLPEVLSSIPSMGAQNCL